MSIESRDGVQERSKVKYDFRREELDTASERQCPVVQLFRLQPEPNSDFAKADPVCSPSATMRQIGKIA